MTTNNKKKISGIFLSKEIGKFLLVGGFAAGVNFLSRMLFRPFSTYAISVILGYLMGTIVSFIFNKTFTFKAYNESPLLQFLKFLLVTPTSILLGSIIASLSVNMLSNLLIPSVPINWVESLGHIMAIGVTTIYNYLAIKFFCFKKVEFKKSDSS